MDNPADLQKVKDAIERPLTVDEERVVPNWLGKAWRILQREVPGIPARVALEPGSDSHLSTDDVADVVVAMVERKLRNPDGLRSYSADDFDQTIDSTLSSGQIYVTEAEKASLAPRGLSYGGGGIFSIPLSRE